MKKYPFLLAFIVLLQNATAQQLQSLHSEVDSLRFSVIAKEQRMAIQLNDSLTSLNGGKSLVTFQDISIDDADILITYKIGKLPLGFRYDWTLSLKESSGKVISSAQYELEISNDASEKQYLRWKDATELPLVFGGDYQLYLQVSLLGPVDCTAERPAFTLKSQLIYYASGMIGVGAIAIGYGFNVQQKNNYDAYVKKWENGSNQESAAPDLQIAKNNKKKAAIFIYSGLGIIAVDALLWTMRSVETKKKQRKYDRFCIQPTLSGLNSISSPELLAENPMMGIQMTYRFK